MGSRKMRALLRGGGRLSARTNGIILALHAILAPFVALRGYAATQDGPAHLYGGHILWSLAHDPASPYAAFFSANLHPRSNSLFSYAVVLLEGTLSAERIGGLALLFGLWGLPLSALAFSRSLRLVASSGPSPVLPPLTATWLACPLAYNYFLYRGFFNYALSIPLAFFCLAAVVASGSSNQGRIARAIFGASAPVFAFLASLAHPAAIVFLLVSIPFAALRASFFGRVIASSAIGLLLAFGLASRIRNDGPLRMRFSNPLTSAWMIARTLGITHTWLEVIPAVILLGLLGWGALRAARRLRPLRNTWPTAWPAVLAAGLMIAYFFVPFEFGGAAGLNERIPLFSAMLLIPYVPLTPTLATPSLVGFAVFSVYTALGSVARDARIRTLREAPGAQLIPRGSVVYTVSLQTKLGSVSADLGRHLLADVARRNDLVAAEVFCGHPAHVLVCQPPVPPSYDGSAVQRFEHLEPQDQRRALDDATSPIRQSFAEIARSAPHSDYLLVLGAPLLDETFDRDVVAPLGATLLGPPGAPVRTYRLPPRSAH